LIFLRLSDEPILVDEFFLKDAETLLTAERNHKKPSNMISRQASLALISIKPESHILEKRVAHCVDRRTVAMPIGVATL
jgi:hypothetical protein